MGMPRGGQDLLTQIERDALDEGVPLAATLRKCIALGAQARNADLRDWASQELDGYRDGGIPEYRTVYVPLLIDALTFTHQIRGQQISATDLPDFAQDVISEELWLGQSVGDLDALARNARNAGKASVKMSPPGSAELLKLWNYQRRDSGQGTIMALYWDVNVARIDGVLDQIRTTLVRLVSEMRAAMGDDSSVPSPEQAAHAVNVVLHGGKRNQVTVTTAQADKGASASIVVPGEQKESGWTKTQTIWTVIGVIVAIIALYVAYLQLKN
jgi:AbiTii